MADSEFLKFQDKNGDQSPDACDDLVGGPHTSKCPACTPNANYIPPNWRDKNRDEPWFNEKYCKHQVTVKTAYDKVTPTPDATEAQADSFVQSIFTEHADIAIESILIGQNKENSPAIVESLKPFLEFQQFELEARNFSRVKLLFSIPYDNIAPIGPAGDADEDDSEEEVEPDDVVVQYDASNLKSKVIKVGQAMHLYSRYYRVYSAMEGGNLVFENGKVFTVSQFDRYGKSLGWISTGKGVILDLFNSLDFWLNTRGYNIFEGMGDWKSEVGTDRVKKLEFTFTGTYQLKELKVWTKRCRNKPKVFNRSKLAGLNRRNAWKDPTACSYFARLPDMLNDINARQEQPWIDVIQTHTYPKVTPTVDYGRADAGGDNSNATGGSSSSQTPLSCVGDNLKNEFKQLGQDILDETFSIGDSVAAMFHDAVCKMSLGEAIDDRFKKGLIYDPARSDFTTKTPTEAYQSIGNMAIEQAFGQIEDDELLFTTICNRVLSSAVGTTPGGWPKFTGFAPTNAGRAQQFLDNSYKYGFDRLKICGLFDLLLDALRCLLGGLTLEEALARMCQSALKAMSIENFGKLFIGLPPEKQAELDALVKQKLESGDIFKEGSGLQSVSDAIEGKKNFRKPWEDNELVQAERERQDSKKPYHGMSAKEMQEYSPGERRTLAQQFDVQGAAESQLDPNIVLEAYILALIEVWGGNLLGLVDRLQDFPGASLVSSVFSYIDCPRPPLFDPNFLDFVQSIEIPICKWQNELVLPKLINPFGWIPSLYDIVKLLFMLLMWAIQQILMMVIMKIIEKLCQLLGDAICKALEIVGKVAASLVTGESFADILRDSLCGPDASDEKVNDTMADMANKLGVGGAALANKEDVAKFFSDVSNSVTREEMMNSFLGDTSSAMSTVVDNLLEYEYPQFRQGLPNPGAVADFFKDMGSLFPAPVRQQMRNFLSDLPSDDELPANPSLCISPDDQADFEAMRCEILPGRALSSQCKNMFKEKQMDMLDDVSAISDLLQDPQKALMDAMPPIISQPGCDDGILPFESDEMQTAASAAMGANFNQLKVDFTEDMLGEGKFWSRNQSNWGMMNYVLSDTMGYPLTMHRQWAARSDNYVDYVGQNGDDDSAWPSWVPGLGAERGQFPIEVAGHLQETMKTADTTFNSNNEYQDDKVYTRSFKKLSWENMYGNTDIDLITIPDFGYNVTYSPDLNSEKLKITRLGRKAEPDIRLYFEDNNSNVYTGIAPGETKPWSYGFKVNVNMSDLANNKNVGTVSKPEDLTRITIWNRFNTSGKVQEAGMAMMSEADYESMMSDRSGKVINDRHMEFISYGDALEKLPEDKYFNFRRCFEEKQDYLPQIYMLSDLISETTPPNLSVLKESYDQFMSHAYGQVMAAVADNNNAFSYGAEIDAIGPKDAEYGVIRDGNFVSYFDAKNDEGDSLRNDDMELGLSYNAYVNQDDPKSIRVHYLDPMKYGGNYINPPVYIAPLKNKGWMGFVETLFPEYTYCKPRKTNLVDFSEIQQQVDETYNSIPVDPRLKEQEKCVVEVPYNRVLNRPAAAGIQGIIQSACRIYASTHMIKSMATMTTFAPKFPEMYSKIYASYIVEDMEKSFRDAQGAFWEIFNPFKDDEFWYAFLEQSVQTYGRLVDDGKINPTQSILDTLIKLNDVQDNYDFPYKKELRRGKALGEHRLPTEWPFTKFSLKVFREEKNFEAVQASEELAKMILKEMVVTELNAMGKVFMSNLETLGLTPKYTDARFYLLTEFSQGATDLDLHKEIIEEPVGLPESGDNHYTEGATLSVLSTGEPYEGFYHVHTNEDGQRIYMEGESHSEEPHEELLPFADKIEVPIGDVSNYPATATMDTSKPFILEKYMVVNNIRYSVEDAIFQVHGVPEASAKNVSEVFPGNLRLVYPLGEDGIEDQSLDPIGVDGNLGVRYGIAYSIVLSDGSKNELAHTEIDVLDLKCSQVPPVTANSKLLYCLIHNLVNSDEFKLISDYVFPINKVVSTVAIYNDMGFLPSIGEITVDNGASFQGRASDGGSAPGTRMNTTVSVDPMTGEYVVGYDTEGSTAGWTSFKDRQPHWVFQTGHYDMWDKDLLRNSKSRIKKMFKSWYYDRDFKANGGAKGGEDPASFKLSDLLSAFKASAGTWILPWYRRNRVRSSPFDKDGNECSRK